MGRSWGRHLGARSYVNKGRREGVVEASPLVVEKAGLAGTKDSGSGKVKDLHDEWIY